MTRQFFPRKRLINWRCERTKIRHNCLPFFSTAIPAIGLILALIFSLAVTALSTSSPVEADPGGPVLWGITGVNFCNAGDYSEVFKVDTDTGSVTIIAAVTDGSLYSDITETPNGNLYTIGMDYDGNTGSTGNFHDFYRLDPDTGAVIGNWTGVITKEVNALYAESDTSLLAIEVGISYDPELLRINLDESGDYESITAIGTLPSGLISGGDLAKDPISGKWYAAFGPNTESEIWEVDIVNPGNSVKASDSGILGVAGLAFYSDGTAYTGSWKDKNLYTVDIAGGGHSIVHSGLTLNGNIFGLSSDFHPPAAPADLSAASGDTLVPLNWNDNAEADLAGYNVYRSETSGGPYTQINTATITVSDYTDTGLTNGTDYYYVVTALDIWNNESGNSSEANAIPQAAPDQPGNILPANGDTDISVTPTLQSSDFSDPDAGNTHAASQWQITSTAGNYSSSVFDSDPDATNLTDITIPSGYLTTSVTYHWHVRHQDNNGAWSDWSIETSFTTIDTTPNQPPVADTGPDQEVMDVDEDEVEIVILDGSGSYDLDGTIVTYEWTEGDTVLTDNDPPANDGILTHSFPLGLHSLTLTVTDNLGATDSDSLSVIVGKEGGCFIATAAYGTPMAEQIDILRDFRDRYMLTNPVGEALVHLYYNTSPPVADFIARHPVLKQAVRTGLEPAVVMSSVVVNTTTAQKIAILCSMVLVSTLLTVWLRRRAGKVRVNTN